MGWDIPPASNADYGAFIWDLNASKNVWSRKKTGVELFFSAHNLFNGSQYLRGDIENPGRWVEVGTRISF